MPFSNATQSFEVSRLRDQTQMITECTGSNHLDHYQPPLNHLCPCRSIFYWSFNLNKF